MYACAAGAVLHAHAADTLEPAVLLYTFLPPIGDRLDAAEAGVDVHGDGPGSGTVTVRVLADGRSLSWQLPIAPFVAALPGQPGGEGRMVLLGIVDSEPEQGFWAQPVDCERLAAELQLPVADLLEALRGRLTPWLANDLEALLHDDAHDHAVDRSPAQTLASAVIAEYAGDLTAEQATGRLVRALALAPEDFQLELGRRLAIAVAAAFTIGTTAAPAVLGQTGPFETEVIRLLSELPASIGRRDQDPAVSVSQVLLAGPDLDETARAAVSVIARLARAALGPDVGREELLRRLNMVDDAGLARLAGLWVQLAALAGGTADAPPADGPAAAGGLEPEAATVRRIAEAVVAASGPGWLWLRDTAADLATASVEVAGRHRDRLAEPLERVGELLGRDLTADTDPDPDLAVSVVSACLTLARFARARGGVGAGSWLAVPAYSAATAVGAALAGGLDRAVAVRLFDQLLEPDVVPPELLDAFACATSQVLVELDPATDPSTLRAQVQELIRAVPGGPKGARWVMASCVRLAPTHDPAALDLSGYLPGEPAGDHDRAATRAGRAGVLTAGLSCLEAVAGVLGTGLDISREELLGAVLPAALLEHDLLRRTV